MEGRAGKMRKKAGIVLCIIGVLLVIIAVIMLLITPAHKDEQANDNKDITEVTQEIKDEKQSDTTTEHQEGENQKTSQEQADNNTENKLQSNTEVSSHAINPEVYKWPCGNKCFQDWDEPRQVTEFAKYKEYYEQIAQQFLEYEGKDVDFYATDDMLYFDECKNEGSVKVSYDKEKLMELLEKSKIDAFTVCNDYIIFYNNFSYDNYIMYLYDETLTYNDPFPSEKDDLISSYWMVNIAPHWWWEDLGPGD